MAKKSEHLVRFFKGTSEQYDSITPDMYTFYFLTDVDKVLLGNLEISNSAISERIDYINQQLEDKASIAMKTTQEWNSLPNQIGELNTFYIYTDRNQKEDGEGNIINIPGIKVGDGRAYLIDLPFIDDLMLNHINNVNVHIQIGERAFWNNKLNIDDSQEVIIVPKEDYYLVNNELIFNRS